MILPIKLLDGILASGVVPNKKNFWKVFFCVMASIQWVSPDAAEAFLLVAKCIPHSLAHRFGVRFQLPVNLVDPILPSPCCAECELSCDRVVGVRGVWWGALWS